MTKRPPTPPKPITAARLEKIRKADPELVELLDSYVAARLRNNAEERVKLLKLRRVLAPVTEQAS